MPQGPTPVAVTNSGGNLSALNIQAAAVIKATPGRIARMSIIAPGSAGNFVFNDVATVGAAAVANQVWIAAFNAAGIAAGAVIAIDMPCLVGIVLSAIPTGAIVSVSYN